MYSLRTLLTGLMIASLLGCGASGSQSEPGDPSQPSDPSSAALQEQGEAIKPPFEVKGELEGLLIVWFDDAGQHSAKTRADVPEARREHVRIDSLAVPPDQRLDGDHVYVADLRKPAAGGGYAVQKRTRAWLEAHVQSLLPVPEEPSGDVTMYMASWCGACKAAAAYMRSRDVPFVEKDIERDAAAASEMRQKAQAAGKTPRGVPVIDFRGTLLMGYDQQALATLIDQGGPQGATQGAAQGATSPDPI